MSNRSKNKLKNKIFREYKIQNIDLFKNYEQNSRTHSEDQIQEVVNSINEFGYTNPILVDENNIIIAGHCRVEGAKRAGMSEIPTIIIDGLTDVQKAALVIADNKLALNAGWDYTKLAHQITFLRDNGYNTELTGFKADEIASFMPEVVPEFMGDEDDVPDTPVEPIKKLGDVWLLDKHRLMCGDATMINDVDLLTNGEKPDMVFTDPPYGIDYQDVKHRHKKIDNDDSLGNISDLLSITLTFDCPIFICCNWKCFSTFEKAMIDSNKAPKACIVWDKGYRVQNLDKFGKQHEFILYYGKFGGEKTVDVDIWQCDREVRSDHPTAKPISLIERALSHFNIKSVLDLFGGSGSTLIACEKSKRKCFMMELDPRYCDVIIARWVKFTGKKAVLEASHGAGS